MLAVWGFIAGIVLVPALRVVLGLLDWRRVERVNLSTRERRQQMAQGRM